MSASVTYLVGDALSVLRTLPDGSADCLITSPPYPWQRAYLPPDHPDKCMEVGQEATPADALASLLDVMDECWRVLSDDATFWVNLGDVHAGSGGAGGDYNEDGLRAGQARYDGTASKARRYGLTNGDRPRQARDRWRANDSAWPREQSVCWISHLFGASLAYGRNLLNGMPCRQWVTRPPVTWCKPSPSVGRLDRRFRTATELFIYGGKHQRHFFDLDAVRSPSDYHRPNAAQYAVKGAGPGVKPKKTLHAVNPNGTPPNNWWVVSHPGYTAAHFATFPPELIVRPVLAGCPEGGTILDPFAGTGTTGVVAHGHGRSSILIDLDARNLDLCRERFGPIFASQIATSLDSAVPA